MFSRSQSHYVECDNTKHVCCLIAILLLVIVATASSEDVQSFVGFSGGRNVSGRRLPNTRLGQFSQLSDREFADVPEGRPWVSKRHLDDDEIASELIKQQINTSI